jgi:malate dehydrogenase (oxaloacetate-decarboxylating)
MEGKAALFKRFAGIDAWPLCLDTQDADEIVRTVQAIAPGFAGINLEDISAPRCFEIEKRLRDALDIPVFHDDQHGTAIVVLAALTNALRVVDKALPDVQLVMCGAGAAGTAVLRLLLHAGAGSGKGSVVVTDVDGILHRERPGLDGELRWVAENTNPADVQGDLRTALRGADVFVGVSAPGLLDADDVATMSDDAIVFALANPDPEIEPGEARRHAAVVATGRSDHPNQINNVLAFPGVFRGLLDSHSRTITLDVLRAAASAIATVVTDSELNADYVIPSVFHPEVHDHVAQSVRDAVRTGREDG